VTQGRSHLRGPDPSASTATRASRPEAPSLKSCNLPFKTVSPLQLEPASCLTLLCYLSSISGVARVVLFNLDFVLVIFIALRLCRVV
jgi:hypothetical protein